MTAPAARRGTPRPGWLRRGVLLAAIVVAQFAVFEAALRTWGSSEAAPAFQGLFESDPVLGYRMKPGARTHFKTSEFAADIAINAAGFRDDEELGPKPANERRILLLGDSLVLSVQVGFDQTFGELLERRLNRRASKSRYRVVNAGVQGYGPIEEQLFFRSIVDRVRPDLVIVVVFVGNDAEEAVGSLPKLSGDTRSAASAAGGSLITRLRRLVRRSMVLQILRLRAVAVTDRFTPHLAPPEPPLQSYAASPAPRIAEGLAIARRSIEDVATRASAAGAATMVALMPARFQVDDADYLRLKDAVAQAGGELLRDEATARFDRELASVKVPRVDLLPALRAALPGPDVFYQETVHLTPRGHDVVAAALDAFVSEHWSAYREEHRSTPR
jgi:lysophospholipase L1-like esterase